MLPIVSTTPAPSSTANQRCTPGKRENGPLAETSATLTRTCHASPRGRTSKGRVTPPPLRHGWEATSAVRTVVLAGMRSYTAGPCDLATSGAAKA